MIVFRFSFFFNDPATTEIYTNGHTLSLHYALPILEILSLVRIIGALAGHGELVLLRHDLDVVGSEPCDRQGDAEAVIAKLHNIEERIAVVLACSRLKQVEKTVKADRGSPVRRKVEVEIGRAPCRERVCQYG